VVRAKNSKSCDPRAQGLVVATRLRYAVRQNSKTVGELDALMLHEYSVIIIAYSVLMIDSRDELGSIQRNCQGI
jgi:hypothetical protein